MNNIFSIIRRRISLSPELDKIVDNIGWLFFDKFMRMGVGLLVGVWVARYLGPNNFGVLNFATAFVGIFGTIASLGLPSIVVRDLLQRPSDSAVTLGTAALIQLCGGIITYIFLLATIICLRTEDQLTRTIVTIIGSGLLFKVTEISMCWFESQVQSKYTVWVQNSVFLVFAGVKATLILLHAPLITFAWSIFGETLATTAILLYVFNSRGYRIRRLNISKDEATKLLTNSWPLMISSIAIIIYMRIDQIMLGEISGNESVGIYTAAMRICELWYFIPISITASFFPSILKVKKINISKYYEKLQNLYNLMAWISISISSLLYFFSDHIVYSLYGESFSQSSDVLRIYIWSSVFVFLGIAGGKWFIAENLQRITMMRTIFGAIINIILNILTIPKYGVTGAAWSTVASQAIASLFADSIHPKTRITFKMKIKALNPITLFHLINNKSRHPCKNG